MTMATGSEGPGAGESAHHLIDVPLLKSAEE